MHERKGNPPGVHPRVERLPLPIGPQRPIEAAPLHPRRVSTCCNNVSTALEAWRGMRILQLCSAKCGRPLGKHHVPKTRLMPFVSEGAAEQHTSSLPLPLAIVPRTQ